MVDISAILCRKRAELEEQLIVEEVGRRVKEEVEKRVAAAMDSEAVQASLQERLVAERKILEEQVLSSGRLSAQWQGVLSDRSFL